MYDSLAKAQANTKTGKYKNEEERRKEERGREERLFTAVVRQCFL